MRLAKIIEEFYQDRARVDKGCAVAAGFCVWSVDAFFMLSHGRSNPWWYIRTFILANFAYLLIASLASFARRHMRATFPPSWVTTATLGSVFFVLLDMSPAVIRGWYQPYRVQPTLWAYLSNEIDHTVTILGFFITITLLVTAVVYYAPDIARAAKEWHRGENLPSILK